MSRCRPFLPRAQPQRLTALALSSPATPFSTSSAVFQFKIFRPYAPVKKKLTGLFLFCRRLSRTSCPGRSLAACLDEELLQDLGAS